MFIRHRGLALLCAIVSALPAFALAEPWDAMPLQSKNPERPIEVIADKSWGGEALRRNQDDEYALGSVEHKAGKGPLHVVVDYMAAREGEAEGRALVTVYLWCYTPGGLQANQWHVIGFETDFMSAGAATISGTSIPVWAARQSRGFLLEDGVHCSVELAFQEPENIRTEAVRARLIYGQHENASLAGQPTRAGLLLTILMSLAAAAAFLWWWVRRG